MNDLDAISRKASQCVKCGTCMADCPVYGETLSEVTSPRGKLSLIESLASGEIRLSGKLHDILFSCLACDSCGENCPNKVAAGEILLAARKELVNHRGLSPLKRFFFRHVLSSLKAMSLYFRAGSLMQGLLLKKIPEGSGLHLRFPLPSLDKKRLIPPIAKTFFRDYQPLLAEVHPEKKRVGFFVGCVNNYLFPPIAESSVRLINRSGISVVTPSDQNCCGLMAYGAGDWASARKCALANIASFESHNLDTIITSCASCAATLKIFYPRMFQDADDATRRRVQQFSSSVRDISQFLAGERNQAPVMNRKDYKHINMPRITYHDPCHLKRTLGIFQEPRELLRSLPRLEFVEMDDASKCCGMGGTFTITHYDLSMSILSHKLDTLEAMGADMLATGCSGCLLQFMDGIHQRGLKTRVVHLVEALERGQDKETGEP